jgi:hypothetical protein
MAGPPAKDKAKKEFFFFCLNFGKEPFFKDKFLKKNGEKKCTSKLIPCCGGCIPID